MLFINLVLIINSFDFQLDIHLEETTADQTIKSVDVFQASQTSQAKRRTQSATRISKSIGIDHVEETCEEKSVDQLSLVEPSVKTEKKLDKSKAANVTLQSGVILFSST